jgi:hypothetical protein
MSERFQKSAIGALSILSRLLAQAEEDSTKLESPQLLEMLTLCRETNLRLPVLEVFSKVADSGPLITLIGGQASYAGEIAEQMGLAIAPIDVPETPLMWFFEGGAKERTLIQVGATERELSDTALNALLSSPLPPDRVTMLHKVVQSDSSWRFAWLPDPEALAMHAGWPAVLEALVGAQVIVFIGDDVPSAFQTWFSRPGLIVRQFAATEFVRDDVRLPLLEELALMNEQSYSEQQAVHAATWNFLLPRIVDQLDSLRQQYTLEIDRQNMKLQTTRQTLGEYRRNWSNGIKNELDDFFSKKATGQAMSALLDPKQSGPTTETYLKALSLPSLWKKLHELLTDRLGEFVPGLGALATRVELRSISLKEVEMRWNPAALAQQLEDELNAKRTFQQGGGEKSGLVGALMGKNDEIVSARKAQITRAGKTVQSVIEQDFLQWSDNVLHTVEQRVRVQIAAAQVNQGLPDIESLRTGLTGIDRLTAMLEGKRDETRSEPVKRVGSLLRGWSQRRWIRRYAPSI